MYLEYVLLLLIARKYVLALVCVCVCLCPCLRRREGDGKREGERAVTDQIRRLLFAASVGGVP